MATDFWRQVGKSIAKDGPEAAVDWWEAWGPSMEELGRDLGSEALESVVLAMTCNNCEHAQRTLMSVLPYAQFVEIMRRTVDQLSGIARRRRMLLDALEDLVGDMLGVVGRAMLGALRGGA